MIKIINNWYDSPLYNQTRYSEIKDKNCTHSIILYGPYSYIKFKIKDLPLKTFKISVHLNNKPYLKYK